MTNPNPNADPQNNAGDCNPDGIVRCAGGCGEPATKYDRLGEAFCDECHDDTDPDATDAMVADDAEPYAQATRVAKVGAFRVYRADARFGLSRSGYLVYSVDAAGVPTFSTEEKTLEEALGMVEDELALRLRDLHRAREAVSAAEASMRLALGHLETAGMTYASKAMKAAVMDVMKTATDVRALHSAAVEDYETAKAIPA